MMSAFWKIKEYIVFSSVTHSYTLITGPCSSSINHERQNSVLQQEYTLDYSNKKELFTHRNDKMLAQVSKKIKLSLSSAVLCKGRFTVL